MSIPTHTGDLKLPIELQDLLRKGRWPRNDGEARAQNTRPLVPGSRVAAATDGDEGRESNLYLDPPPFATAETCADHNAWWRSEEAAPEGIDLRLALVIGDFGLGSDAPIILDYREHRGCPSVLRLKWAQEGNRWVEMAPSFADFARVLKL